ncbi:MAG TPA: hypothetical protein VHM91_07985 [Verrucomicrobiales bacterium]|jgi:hypothetical protein|nr:hypothetical protein [Verrucomicrobiales bacterium]
MPSIDEQREAALAGVLTSLPATAPADAEMRRWVYDAQQTAASLLLASAPAVAAPEDSWEGIRSALALRRQRQALRKKLRTAAAYGGWAAAACLAVALVMQRGGPRSSRGEDGQPTTSVVPSNLRPPGPHGDRTSPPGGLPGNYGETAEGTTEGRPPGGLHKQMRPARDYQLVQSLDRLRDEVSRLRAGDAERYESRNGVARVVVMELNGQPATGTPAKQPRLTSDKLSDIVAAGLSGKSGETPPSSDVPPAEGSTPPEKRPITLRPGDTWNGEFVVPAGEPLPDFSLLNLPPGVSIRYGSLPLEDPVWAENFHPVTGTAGTYYDVRNDVIWSPSNDYPGEFTGRRPGAEFNKDTYALQPDSTQPPASGSGSTPVNGSGYSAWTIFDETTGRGSIIVEDMAPAPEGMVYRLSFEDTAHGRTVQVGDLPELESGSGRVQFEMGLPGYAPSSWQLHLVDRKTGAATRVLQGPGSR